MCNYLSVATAGHTFMIQPDLLTNLIIRQFDIRHKLPQNQQCRIKEGRREYICSIKLDDHLGYFVKSIVIG